MRQGAARTWGMATLALAATLVAGWWLTAGDARRPEAADALASRPVQQAPGVPAVVPPEPTPQVLGAPQPSELAAPASGPAVAPEPAAGAAETAPASVRVRFRVLAHGEFAAPPEPHAELAVKVHGAAGEVLAERVHRTDARGELALTLPPGSLFAAAWSRDRASAPLDAELAVGPELEFELALDACATVIGEVRDALSGLPVVGARVALGWRRGFDRALTDAQGFYELPRVGHAEFFDKLVVDADGYGPEQVFLKAERSGRWSVRSSDETLGARSGSSSPVRVDLTLHPTASYRGRVVDLQGRPVSGAHVTALGYYTILTGASTTDRASAVTDAEGGFAVEGLRSDITHRIAVRAARFAESVHTPGLPESQPERDLGEIRLVPESVLGVAVVTPSGAPAEGLTVELRAARSAAAEADADARDEPRGRGSSYAPRAIERDALTDDAGYARFDGLPSGAYDLFVSLSPRIDRFVRTRVELGEGQDVVAPLISVPATLDTLEGVVVGPDGGAAHARVALEHDGRSLTTVRTDSEGAFRVAGLPARAQVRLIADWDDDARSPWRAEFAGTSRDRPVLRLRPRQP